MKITQLLKEVKLFKNNFVRISMAETAIAKLYPTETPKINFDDLGMYIILDTFQIRDYENIGMNGFTLSEAGIVNEIKNLKKFYIEYIKPIEKQTTPHTEEKTDIQ